MCAIVRFMSEMTIRSEGAAMNFEDLTPEQQEKAKACSTFEELLSLAKEEGYELSDEELGAVSGGGFWDCDDNSCGSDCRDEGCSNYCHAIHICEDNR